MLPLVAPCGEWKEPNQVNILFFRRFERRKGVHDLRAAMPEVIELTEGRARMLVVGDSYLRPQIEAEVPAAFDAATM